MEMMGIILTPRSLSLAGPDFFRERPGMTRYLSAAFTALAPLHDLGVAFGKQGVPGSPSQLSQPALFAPYQSVSLLELKWIPECSIPSVRRRRLTMQRAVPAPAALPGGDWVSACSAGPRPGKANLGLQGRATAFAQPLSALAGKNIIIRLQ